VEWEAHLRLCRFGTRQAPARANFEAAFKQALGTLIGSAGGQLLPILQRSSGDPQAPRGFSFCLVALEDTEECAGAAGRLINPKCHSRITSGCITIPKNMLTLGHCSKWQLPSASATAQHSVASVTIWRGDPFFIALPSWASWFRPHLHLSADRISESTSNR
jgi:hypothetical protein